MANQLSEFSKALDEIFDARRAKAQTIPAVTKEKLKLPLSAEYFLEALYAYKRDYNKFIHGEFTDLDDATNYLKHCIEALNNWPKGLFLHVPSLGCVYRREGSSIMGTPVNADGTISMDYDNWFLVDQDRGDEIPALLKALEAIYERNNF